MEQCVLTIGTITQAIRARKLLSTARMGARVIKNVNNTTRSGCAYGLEIWAEDMPRAMRILRENDIAFEWSRERATDNG